jgi:hypothetical protein
MIKKLASPVLVLLVCSFSVAVQAQTNDPRVYTDAHAVFIHLQDKYTFDVGVGSRVGYNLTENLAVEGEVIYFPANKIFYGGKKEQGFVSLKLGKRFDRVGFFAKVGPGFMILSKGRERLATDRFGCNGDPGSYSCFDFKKPTSLAGNVGGVFELYTSKHTFIRLDAGNTFLEGGPYAKSFQTSSGFGFRF